MSHIALILPDLVAGGAQRVMLMLAHEFVARGHRVDLVLLQAEGQLQSSVPQGVRLVDLHSRTRLLGSRGFAVRAIVRLAYWLRNERPDAVLSSVTGTNIATVLAWKLVGARPRLVLREVSTLRNVRSRSRLWAMRLLYPRVDAVVALSRAMAAELVQVIGVPEKHLFCIPNPVDREALIEQSKAAVDHPWLENKQAPVIISVGRLIEAKDYPTLLRALDLVVRETPVKLLILGEGPERRPIEALIKDLRLQDSAELIGFDPNPWRWMARADLYVLSSLWEGSPNTLLEAWALGRRTLVTSYDDSVFDLAAEFHSAVTPPGDSVAMAQAIKQCLRVATPARMPVDQSSAPNAADGYLSALRQASSLRKSQPVKS